MAYGLGSEWVAQPTQSLVFGFKDDLSGKTLTTHTLTPAKAPIGNTNVLLGLQGGSGVIQVVPLTDAPEGGTCHPLTPCVNGCRVCFRRVFGPFIFTEGGRWTRMRPLARVGYRPANQTTRQTIQRLFVIYM